MFYENTKQYWTMSQAITEHYRIKRDKGICMIYRYDYGFDDIDQLSLWTVFIYVYVYNLLIDGFSFTEWRLI